jgi:hypothetical protein
MQKSMSPDRGIVGFHEADVGDVFRLMSARCQQARKGGRQLGIHQEAHGSAGDPNRMIGFEGSVFQAGVIGEDLGFVQTGGQQFEHILDTDAHAPNAGASAALVGMEGDPFQDRLI